MSKTYYPSVNIYVHTKKSESEGKITLINLRDDDNNLYTLSGQYFALFVFACLGQQSKLNTILKTSEGQEAIQTLLKYNILTTDKKLAGTTDISDSLKRLCEGQKDQVGEFSIVPIFMNTWNDESIRVYGASSMGSSSATTTK